MFRKTVAVEVAAKVLGMYLLWMAFDAAAISVLLKKTPKEAFNMFAGPLICDLTVPADARPKVDCLNHLSPR